MCEKMPITVTHKRSIKKTSIATPELCLRKLSLYTWPDVLVTFTLIGSSKYLDNSGS